MRRTIATLATVTLAGIGVLHAVWAFSPWPFDERATFSDAVVGVPVAEAPSAPMTLGVAVLLAAAAALVAVRGGLTRGVGPAWMWRWGTWTVAGVLLLRGLGGLLASALQLGTWAQSQTFQRLDLLVYSPLCLVLGGAVALVAAGRSGSPVTGAATAVRA